MESRERRVEASARETKGGGTGRRRKTGGGQETGAKRPGASWGVLAGSWGLWEPLGDSWGLLEASWGLLASPGVVLGRPGASLGLLVVFWAVLAIPEGPRVHRGGSLLGGS